MRQRVQGLRMSLYIIFVIPSACFPKPKDYFLQQHQASLSCSFSSSFFFLKQLTLYLHFFQRLAEKHNFGILKSKLTKARIFKTYFKIYVYNYNFRKSIRKKRKLPFQHSKYITAFANLHLGEGVTIK